MDKPVTHIQHVDAGGVRVHKCPQTGWTEINEAYGLWIISSRPSQTVGGHEPPYQRLFEFYAISHVLEGDCFYLDKAMRRQNYSTGQGTLMVPDYLHYYGAGAGAFTEDTIRFVGPLADHLCRAGILAPGVITIGKHRRLAEIVAISDDPSVNAQIKANFLLQKLLTDLYFENLELRKLNHANEISDIIQMIQTNPDKWWTIPELAEMCRLSDDQFRNVFKRETGMSPKLYIDRIKINKAAGELSSSNTSIAAIADKYGYSDPYHFSRRFKQILGMSPDHYRKTHAWH